MKSQRDMSRWVAAGLAALLLAGCQGNGGFSGLGSRGSGSSQTQPAVSAPEGQGEYSILLCSLNEPTTHVQDAEYIRKVLAEQRGWKGLFIINAEGHSDLYWGRYASQERAQANLRTARNHRTQAGTYPFIAAMVGPLPGADIGPAAWNLKNVRAPYTYLVATFSDDAARKYVGRKQFAVNYCKQLRDGGYEGYFHHGAVVSLVTIGAFPASSVLQSGEQTKIVDARVEGLKRDFPLLAVNGLGENEIFTGASGKKLTVPKVTILIKVPHDGRGASELPGVFERAQTPPQPAQPPPTGTSER